jgi:hypothetical protein
MCHRSLHSAAALASLAILAFLAPRSASAREVEFDANCRPQFTAVEQRLFDMSREGVGTLRQYLFARRAIYDLPIYETAVWAEQIFQRHVQCLIALEQSSLAASAVNAPAGDARAR